MARIANLKEHILDVAKKIAMEQGIINVNVRLVAKESGIALGTIYNYYPAKGDLIAAVIEDFWKTAFGNIAFAELRELNDINALERIYYQLLSYLNSFKQNWLQQLSLLSANDKMIGRKMEQEYLQRIYHIILNFLEQDDQVMGKYSSDERAKLAEFIFGNMLGMLKQGEEDFTLFKKILGKIMG